MKHFKTLILTIALILSASTLFALPTYFYGNIAIKTDGTLVTSSNIQVRITLYDGATLLYQETFNPVAVDAFGAFTVEVGTGTLVSGAWPAGDATVNMKTKAEIDYGSGWVSLGSRPTMQIIYASTTGFSGDPSEINVPNGEIIIGDASGVGATHAVSGDATISNTGVLTLASTAVTAGTYGDGTHVAQITVDGKGRLTSASDVAIAFPAETDPVWTAAEPDYGNLTENEVITGNWVNTANPWADNEVVDALTINGGTVTNSTVTPGTGHVTADYFVGSSSTTNAVDLATSEVAGVLPDANVADNITIDGGTVTNSTVTPGTGHVTADYFVGIGSTTNSVDLATSEVAGVLPDANVADNITIDGGTVTNSTVTPGTGHVTADYFVGSSSTTNAVDLATSEVAGVLPDANVADALTIDGGTIDATPIGGTTPSTGAFTTLQVNSTLNDGSSNGTTGQVLAVAADNTPEWKTLSTLETDPVWVAAEPNYANLGQNETITGNWVNTANPWADNEVADNLTINGGTVTNSTVTPGTGHVTADYFVGSSSTTNAVDLATSEVAGVLPDANVADNITIDGGTVTNSTVTPGTGHVTADYFVGIGSTTNSVDLATSEVAGVLPDANVADALTINGGTVNNTPIGATTPATGAFTTLTATTSNLGTVASGTWQGTAIADTYVADNLTINGGTIDATPIGGTTPAAGTFTTLTATTSNLGTVASGTWQGTAIADTYVADNLTINGGTVSNSTITVADNVFTIQDDGDNTKQAQFELSGITTATTRTYTLPDANGTILLNGDIGVTVQPYNANTTILGSAIDLTSEVTGTLPIANGGTGATTANAALNNLLPSQTGNAGEFLTTDGTNTSWAPISVTLQAAYNGGNSITTTALGGDITIDGTQKVVISGDDGLLINNSQGAGASAMLKVNNLNNAFDNAVASFTAVGSTARAAIFLSASSAYTVKTENSSTGNALEVSNTGGGTGLYIDNQGSGGLAIDIQDVTGGAVKLSYNAGTVSSNALTIPNGVSVYMITSDNNGTNDVITMPIGVNGQFLYVVYTTSSTDNANFGGIYTTTQSAQLTFVYAGGAWRLISYVE